MIKFYDLILLLVNIVIMTLMLSGNINYFIAFSTNYIPIFNMFIFQVLSSEKQKPMARICPASELVVPLVYNSSMSEVVVTYSWEPGTESIMGLSVSFYNKSK